MRSKVRRILPVVLIVICLLLIVSIIGICWWMTLGGSAPAITPEGATTTLATLSIAAHYFWASGLR